MPAFEGIYTPLITFFDEGGAVDVAAQQRHVGHLVKAGVHGLVPMASMGEFTSMDREERRVVAEAVIEEASGRAKVVVGAGAPSTGEAVDLALDAEGAGADGVMVVTPFYIRPDASGLRRHYRAIRKAVEIPVMAYNLPSFTGVDLPVELVLELARDGIVHGLKDSSGDLTKAIEIVTAKPEEFAFLTGQDPLLASVLLLGGQGGVVGSTNAFPHLAVQLYRLVEQGKVSEAMEIQRQLIGFTQALRVGTFPAAAKHMVERAWGLRAYPRPPAAPLTPEERKRVDALVKPLLPG